MTTRTTTAEQLRMILERETIEEDKRTEAEAIRQARIITTTLPSQSNPRIEALKTHIEAHQREIYLNRKVLLRLQNELLAERIRIENSNTIRREGKKQNGTNRSK